MRPNMGENMMNAMEKKKPSAHPCSYKEGTLPSCAPLGVGFIPFQQENPPMYKVNEALTKGTLFPGLDLPWFNVSNTSNPYEGTPLGELMALSFAIKELNCTLTRTKTITKRSICSRNSTSSMRKPRKNSTKHTARRWSPTSPSATSIHGSKTRGLGSSGREEAAAKCLNM